MKPLILFAALTFALSAWAADKPVSPSTSTSTSTSTATPNPHLEIAPEKSVPKGQLTAKLRPASSENTIVYKEAGRYGGWPANHGLWQWGDELVVGFDSTWYKETTTDHRIDRTKPSYAYQARSLDGGRTWKTETDLPFSGATKETKPAPLTTPLDFTAPNFSLMFRFGGLHAGPSWFYTSTDRCKTWVGPYSFTVEGIDKICTRTDLIVLGPKDCLMFGSCAKQSDGKEGRVFCARTTDGGLTWKLVSLIGPEPVEGGYAIMPSSLRLKDGSILTLIRRSDPKVSGFIEAWRSTDLGKTWTLTGKAVTGIGGNPPALVQLRDGRVAFSYGFRHKPSGIRACISSDGGLTWGAEIILREDGFDGDLGYPRSVVRPDGKVLTIYYYNGPKGEDRAIEATLWAAPPTITEKPKEKSATTVPATDSADWGAYSIVPVSAKAMVLEAVSSGTTDGTVVSIGKPTGTPNQKWFITAKEGGYFSIKPSYSSTLALSASKGGNKNGTPIVLETDANQPWQLWSLKKLENGTYSLLPKHAPELGIDDFGGKQEPGSKIDLWTHRATDEHLQWVISPLAGSGVATVASATEAQPTYEAPAIDPAAILPGEIKQFTFNTSAIFPGTTREVTVFIPAQYDGSQPACVYVKTDGYNAREKTLMETMIATKEMPVTVGVFVRPGELPAPMKGTVARRNRCFEYDGISDNNVRFFTEELLPYIAKTYGLKLSTDGNDRCISGGSSGGIAAFTAAWHQPEAFSRVYAASGSWVAFRGGHEFPIMVRKFEAKPIRAFLTTATHDMENAAGDWFLTDQEMDKALKFSGYDYQFRIINGRHVAGYMENYREAMAYLWKGWPERVKAGPSAPRAQDVLLPNEGWQLVAEGFKDARGPASNASGEVFFTDAVANKIHRIDPEGQVSEFINAADHPNGLTMTSDGKLCSVSAQSGKVISYDAKGNPTTLAKDLPGHSILATPTGGFYITPPTGKDGLWFFKDGTKTLVDPAIKHATGLAYRPDQWLLSVADGQSKWAYSYQMNADGSLIHKERFFPLHVADWDDDAGPESICYALEGQMFVATRSGIQICADDGPTQVILPMPDHRRVLGVCLGGKDKDILYAFCGTKIWKRHVKTHAIGTFTPWTKVNGTRL